MINESEAKMEDTDCCLRSQSQPETQEIDSDFTPSPVEETESDNLWGRLYPVMGKLPTLGLINSEYVIGRASSCAVVLNDEVVKKSMLMTFSKQHFKIGKEELRSDNVAYIEDLSSNGTYVNGEKLSRGIRRPLINNDQISLSLPQYKAFVFRDTTADTGDFPEEIKEKYLVSRELGSGAYGKVHLVFDRKSYTKRYAMKTVSKKGLSGNGIKGDPKYIDREISILKALDHPCIIRTEDVIDTPNAVYIVLELMEGGELFDRVQRSGRLSEPEAKLIFYQIVQAVKYLHSKGITHRDLKPENILLSTTDTETLVKVSDFGLSKIVDSQSLLRTFCGSPIYVAPEILGTFETGTYTMKVDIWSMGVILFVCLGGYPPFSKDRKPPLEKQILQGDYSFPDSIWKRTSADAIALIKQMLTVDPERRINIDDILKHKWLQDKSIIKKAKELMKPNVNAENMAPPGCSPPLKRRRVESEVTDT